MSDHIGSRIGQQLGNYHLLRLLGRGGFADVYLGEHVLLKSYAALKLLRVELTDEDARHFLQEAQTLALLNHPHIVRVLDFAVEDGTPFLVMEYAPEGMLRHRYPTGIRLPDDIIIRYVGQVASALQYAHDRHLTHRYVKPENILLGSREEVFLSDFGLALLAPHTYSLSTQVVKEPHAGATAYLSPEQLQGKPCRESDQYALGVLVYEWLCGRLPFRGTSVEIAMQHLFVAPPSLREQVPEISPTIEAVVLKALAKEPEQRFARVLDFAMALEDAYRPMPLLLSPASEPDLSSVSYALQHPLMSEPIWRVPHTFTPLIGRTQELTTICAFLRGSDMRLLTLLGMGGVGKTRLSVQVAMELREHFADGVCFVSLSTITDPQLVGLAIAQELGIRELGELAIFEHVKVALRNKYILLVLDNFEQVVAAAPAVEELLTVCLHLKVLVTSRTPLHLLAEQEFPITPLDLPNLRQLPQHEALAENAAVALFLQRARAILPTFHLTQDNAAIVAEICVRLDGLPLAIELAAARIKLLPPAALLARLSQRLQVLTTGEGTRPERHHTLRNMLKWSYDLLNAEEQQLFQRLSVFVGGCTLEAAAALRWVGDETKGSGSSILDGVASLLDKSLLLQVAQEEEEPRLLMLETVREYGLECLRERGEAEISHRTHALYYLALVEEVELHLKGAEQTMWLGRVEREQENVRAALGWLITREESELALRFCTALWWFWHLRGHWSEGRRWFEAALGQASEPTVLRARALCCAGNLAYDQDDYGRARPLLEESVALYRTLGLQKELASAPGALGVLLYVQSDLAAARPLLEESEALCRTLGQTWELAYILRKLGYLAARRGDLTLAMARAQEGLTLARELGDQSLIATTLCTLGEITEYRGDLMQATAWTQEGLALARKLGDKALVAVALQNLGYLASLEGDMTQAVAHAQEGLMLARELGDKASIALTLCTLGEIASRLGDLAQATSWYHEGLPLAQEIENETLIGWYLIGLARVAAAERQPERAALLFGAAETRLDVKVKMNAIERADYERVVEGVRTQLSRETFAAAWAKGRNMTPEQVLDARGPAMRGEMVSAMSQPSISTKGRPRYPAGLTAREVEVLRLVAQGLTDAQVAERLVITPRTVNFHLTSIYGKIGVSSRAAATRYAIEQKLA